MTAIRPLSPIWALSRFRFDNRAEREISTQVLAPWGRGIYPILSNPQYGTNASGILMEPSSS